MEYTITLDANGGNAGNTTSIKVPFEDNIKDALDKLQDADKPTREGYTFVGWSRNPQGTANDIITANETMGSSPMTLYAVWEKVEYTITLNANGGNAGNTTSIKVPFEDNIKDALDKLQDADKPTREGYTFVGWSRNPQGTANDIITANETMGSSPMTLYAVWEKVEYTITLNANGGNAGNTTSIKVPFDESIKDSLNLLTGDELPTRDGYKLVGWATNQDGSGLITDTDRMGAASITLYAVWDKAPEITGADDKAIKVNDIFNELDGVDAIDPEQGSLKGSINVIENTVDVKNPGKYKVVYEVTDRAGNVTTAERIITVYGEPIITGADDKIIQLGSAFEELAGVEAKDTEGNNLRITVTGTIDENKLGPQKITYTVEDAAGNIKTVERTITVYGEPIITGIDDKAIQLGSNFEELAGVVAQDTEGNNLKVTVTGTIDENVLGPQKITYTVEDAAGNIKTVERTITVYGEPTITGTDDKPIKLGSTFEELAGVEAKDTQGNDLKITVTGTVDENVLGPQKITYTVEDEAGNIKTVERTITVYGEPIITGADNALLKVGTTFDPLAGVSAKDTEGNNLKITVTGTIDENKLGPQKITYTVEDVVGNIKTVERTITVYGIAIVAGTEDKAIQLGSTFDELAGVSAQDTQGNNLKVTVNGTVDENVLGPQKITYTIEDLNGNIEIVERTITVYGEPTITGTDDKPIKLGSTFDPLAGVVAKDTEGNNLKVTVTGTIDENVLGPQKITYTVEDAAGNIKTVERTITVYGEPTITGTDDKAIKLGSTFEELAGVEAKDTQGNDLKITVIGKIDENKLGPQKITYTVEDAAGNIKTVERTITVYGEPTITGTDDKPIKLGSTFEELAGVEAKDTEGNDLKITVTGKVDENVLGPQKITYTVEDAAGNIKTVERTITVYGEPTITGTDDKPIKLGSTFDPLAGVVAKDTEGNNLKVTVTGTIDENVLGPQKITYTVEDAAGNIKTVEREVIVYGTPVITGADDKIIKVNDTFNELDGVTAKDTEGNDLNVTVIKNTVDVKNPGRYEVVYEAKDVAGNTITVEREVIVYGTPEITGATDITLTVGSKFDPLAGVVAKDTEGKELTITVTGDVDVDTPGNYEVIYTVTDAAGNVTTIKRVVTIDGAPEIIGTTDVAIKVGDKFEALDGVFAKDFEEGDLTGNIVVNIDKLDVTKPGKYTVTYTVTDKSGNITTVERVVTVYGEPQISGATDITLDAGSKFDPLAGVVAKDTEGKELTISVSGDIVDVTKPGKYTVTYTVTDEVGNVTTVDRIVIIKETTNSSGSDNSVGTEEQEKTEENGAIKPNAPNTGDKGMFPYLLLAISSMLGLAKTKKGKKE